MIKYLQAAVKRDFIEQGKWAWLFWVFTVLLLLRLVYVQPYNPDAGYYASGAKLILEGLKPYRDFQLGYLPLGIYLLSAFFFITGSDSLEAGFVFIFLVNVLSSWVVYGWCRKKGCSSNYAWVLASVYLLLVVQHEGSLLVLEPIMAFFLLLAFFFSEGSNKLHWLLVGLFVGALFFIKQYGLLFLPLFVWRAVLSKEKMRAKIWFLLLGFMATGLIFVNYFFDEIFYQNLITQTNNRTYQYYGAGIFQWIKGSMNLVAPVAVALCAYIYLYLDGQIRTRQVAFIVVAFLLVSAQFWFKIFPHYYILALPAIMLMLAEIPQKQDWPFLKPLIIFSFTPSLFYLFNLAFSTEIRLEKEKQQGIARQILELTHGYNQNILIVNCDEFINPYLYAVNNFYPPDLRKTRFGFESTPEFTPLIISASYVVLTKEKWWEIEQYNPETLKLLQAKKQVVKPDFILCY